MVLYNGYDISSGGPGSYEIYNADDCAAKCIETFGCEGFTMVPTEPYKGCHLKSSSVFRQKYIIEIYDQISFTFRIFSLKPLSQCHSNKKTQSTGISLRCFM